MGWLVSPVSSYFERRESQHHTHTSTQWTVFPASKQRQTHAFPRTEGDCCGR